MNAPGTPDSAAGVPPTLQEKLNELEILQQSLQDAKARADSYYEQLVRLTAEFENFRKRSEQRIEQARAVGRDEVVEKVLAFADALELAQRSVTPQTPAQSIIQGLKLLGSELDRLLKSLGVEPIDTHEKPFDPAWHEAVEQVESNKPEGTILGEIQRGYASHGRALRHARVRVSTRNSK